MSPQSVTKRPNIFVRIKLWYAFLLVISAIFLVRLFYLQVIRHSYYQHEALYGQFGQFKEYSIPAERGTIAAYNGDSVIPLVLNESKYTLFADPKFVENPTDAAAKIQSIIGGNAKDYEDKMRLDTRYSVLQKKLSKEQHEAIDALDLKGIITKEELYRTYPQGSLAAQTLGFVNDDGVGTYGVEQYLDDKLKGSPGQLKAITDANGVPLVANQDNVLISPKAGDEVVLTIDVAMQKQMEDALKRGLDRARSRSGSIVVMDPQTGAIKAMANYPTYDPGKFYDVKNPATYNNAVVSSPLEVGSVMKPLTMAAALDQGVINKNTSYFDPGFFKVDNETISNIVEDAGSGRRTMVDILQKSLNTGATWLLMQMGGGKINEQARVRWNDYMTNHYHFGSKTGIEQPQEVTSDVPDPKVGYGLNIRYANTAFGQGMSNTPLQMAAALSSVVNGGTYYRPRLVDRLIESDGHETVVQPEVLTKNVVKPETGRTIMGFMEAVINHNYLIYGMKGLRPHYSIGGKTGTAQIANPAGGYYDNKFNGMFTGFVGGEKVQYVVVIRVNEPGIAGYAGARAAAPIFADVSNTLIDNFNVLPKSR